MIIHTDTPTLVDRVALSNALFELAESFALESTTWLHSGPLKEELDRAARLLAELARNELVGRANHDRAEAFHAAGVRKLCEVQALRRFTVTLDTPPNRTRGERRG